MRFMLLVYLDEGAASSKSAEEQDEMFRRCLAHSAQWKSQGVMQAGEALHPTSLSTTVRVRDGRTLLTDGPFAETKEQLGGYYIVSCANQQEALRLAEEVSEVHRDPSPVIEVRPIWEFTGG